MRSPDRPHQSWLHSGQLREVQIAFSSCFIRLAPRLAMRAVGPSLAFRLGRCIRETEAHAIENDVEEPCLVAPEAIRALPARAQLRFGLGMAVYSLIGYHYIQVAIAACALGLLGYKLATYL